MSTENKLTQNKKKELKEFIHKIKQIDILLILEKLNLNLIKSGNSLQGNCPTGHTSSRGRCFSINLKDNYWHCFNCGESGDIIKLVSITKNLSFSDTIEWFGNNFELGPIPLFKEYNIENAAEESDNIKNSLKDQIYTAILNYLHSKLFEKEGERTLLYLTDYRKYNVDILKNTEFCHWTSNADIKNYLITIFPEAENFIQELKLSGSFGDRFDLALPYRNKKGFITGFIKRSIKPEGEIINENGNILKIRYDSTPGLSKKDLFGLYRIKNNTETVIIVEGVIDAEYLYHIGLTNIVAISQGQLSESHIIGLINKKIKTVILAFDNDQTGLQNTEKAIKLLLENSNINILVIDPTQYSPLKDPDEYVRFNGLEKFQDLIRRSVSGIKWLTNKYSKEYEESPYVGTDSEKNIIQEKLTELYCLTSDILMKKYITKILCSILEENQKTISTVLEEAYKQNYIKVQKKKLIDPLESPSRYFVFYEKVTDTKCVYDVQTDYLYSDVSNEGIKLLLNSEGRSVPDYIPILTVTFDVFNEKIVDYEKETFNLFRLTPYMLMEKNNKKITQKDFPHVWYLLSNLIPNYRERKLFLNWLASILQTRKKRLTTWLFRGAQGAGKNLLFEKILKPLFGYEQTKIVEDEIFASQFNSWALRAFFVGFNEIARDYDTRNSVESKIKSIISDPTITINEKFIPAYIIKNSLNCVFFSNKSVPIKIDLDDRRVNVVRPVTSLIKTELVKKIGIQQFVKEIEKELNIFAQFLWNFKINEELADIAIDNEEKRSIINLTITRFEEFAENLKNMNIEWFKNALPDTIFDKENFINDLYFESEFYIGARKEKVTKLFIAIYNQEITTFELSKRLLSLGIKTTRLRVNHNREYCYLIKNKYDKMS